MNYFPAPKKFVVAFILLSLSSAGIAQQAAPQTPHRGLENAAVLAPFFRKLDMAKRISTSEPVRIAHFGDSHVAADILTADIRNHFQTDFGNGGAGYLIAKNPFSTPRWGVVSGATSGWSINGIGNNSGNDGAYGLAGISMTAEVPNERMWIQTMTNAFDVYVLKEPGGATIDVSVDGNSEDIVVDGESEDIPEDASIPSHPVFSLKGKKTSVEVLHWNNPVVGLHRLEIRTVSAGKARVLGIVSENIAPAAGVCYDVLGINGARAKRISDWNPKVLCDTLSKRKPDLIILAYGTNEVTDKDWSVESYSRMLVGILTMFKQAAPGASIIIYGPPDRADNPDATSQMPMMLEAQRKAAKEAGAAFWCSYDAMGGSGSMDSWVSQGLGQGDHVHLTSAGYKRMGDMFYTDVKKAYTDWKARNPTRSRRAGK